MEEAMNTPVRASIVRDDPCFSRFLNEIRRFPILGADEEYVLAERWREHSDLGAAHRLANCHLRLVAKIAKGYRGYGLPVSEVISEGNVGLMQAVRRFEPEKGFRFATYAVWWIKAAIQEYILRSWSLVKMGTTANQKKLFFKLRTAKSRISALEDGDLRPDQVRVIATELAVTERDVIDMNRRLAGDVSLNATVGVERDSGELQDWLVDDTAGQESHLAESEEAEWRHRILRHALAALNERERHIFEQRRLADKPTTLDDLADELGVSRERVRQIEVRAFEKVQKLVKLLDDRRQRSSEVSAMEYASATSQWRSGREGTTRRSRGRMPLSVCSPERLAVVREAEQKRMAFGRRVVPWHSVPDRATATSSLHN
jgi:RNA polymerase sigma-32 factor